MGRLIWWAFTYLPCFAWKLLSPAALYVVGDVGLSQKLKESLHCEIVVTYEVSQGGDRGSVPSRVKYSSSCRSVIRAFSQDVPNSQLFIAVLADWGFFF